MLRRERLSSDMVCNHYSPELPSPVISGGTSLTGSCGAFFIRYRSHGAKLETVISLGRRSPAVRYRQHEDGCYWIS